MIFIFFKVKVERVEIKDVRLPIQMQRAMATEAEATREARAKFIDAEVNILNLFFRFYQKVTLFKKKYKGRTKSVDCAEKSSRNYKRVPSGASAPIPTNSNKYWSRTQFDNNR
jgi:hypothetical protein